MRLNALPFVHRSTAPVTPANDASSRGDMAADRRKADAWPRVVIVGAGFGGLTAAHALRNAPVQVILIDRRNHHLFQPLLYQVATAALSPAEIAWPIRHILRQQRNATVLMAEVNGMTTGYHDNPMHNTSDWLGRFRLAANESNDWGMDREAQSSNAIYSGIDGIHLQDQAITESMGPVTDHAFEHLAPSDQMITRTRRRLLMAARALRDRPTCWDVARTRLTAAVSIGTPLSEATTRASAAA